MTMPILQLVSIMLTAVAMSAGWAHLLELPAKMKLSRGDYLTVQKIYRGWALLGIVVVTALVSTAALAFLQRGKGAFYFSLSGFVCIILSLVVFYAMTFPVNKQTRNWTVSPREWESLRRRWEYSHALNAVLNFPGTRLAGPLIAHGPPVSRGVRRTDRPSP